MPPLRVGHKGAAHIVPGNTRESFAAALAAGVDMIEFDVLSERADGSGRLLLAHDYEDLRSRTPITLEEGLEHLAAEAYAGIALDVDVKLPGYGRRVVEALRKFGFVERSLVSSMFIDDLDAMRRLEPALRVGWSVPRVRRDYTKDRLMALPALLVLRALRLRMPARARAALRAGRVDAIMAHWRVVTPALVAAVAAAGGELYVWTVDDPALVGKLSAWEVTGIITNDPRVFATRVRAAAVGERAGEGAAAEGPGTEPRGPESLPDPAS
jgi:glycerophosphoryl diester phosphodiesterase